MTPSIAHVANVKHSENNYIYDQGLVGHLTKVYLQLESFEFELCFVQLPFYVHSTSVTMFSPWILVTL